MKKIGFLSGLLVSGIMFASEVAMAEDCSGPPVTLGEVMAGFQAGFTGGQHTVTGLPEGFFAAVSGESRRGFVVPETGVASEHCDSDYILVADWFGCSIKNLAGEPVRTVKEAKACAKTGLSGFIVDFHILIDGVRVGHMETNAKLGTLPDGREGALVTAGYFVEPYSLVPGLHTATGVFPVDFNRDGIIDRVFEFVADFTITDSAPSAP